MSNQIEKNLRVPINALIGKVKYWDWTYPVRGLTRHLALTRVSAFGRKASDWRDCERHRDAAQTDLFQDGQRDEVDAPGF